MQHKYEEFKTTLEDDDSGEEDESQLFQNEESSQVEFSLSDPSL